MRIRATYRMSGLAFICEDVPIAFAVKCLELDGYHRRGTVEEYMRWGRPWLLHTNDLEFEFCGNEVSDEDAPPTRAYWSGGGARRRDSQEEVKK